MKERSSLCSAVRMSRRYPPAGMAKWRRKVWRVEPEALTESRLYLDQVDFFGVRSGQKIWRSADRERYYTWDALHGEIEVFNRRGRHLGSLDAITGALVKPAVRGRRITL